MPDMTTSLMGNSPQKIHKRRTIVLQGPATQSFPIRVEQVNPAVKNDTSDFTVAQGFALTCSMRFHWALACLCCFWVLNMRSVQTRRRFLDQTCNENKRGPAASRCGPLATYHRLVHICWFMPLISTVNWTIQEDIHGKQVDQSQLPTEHFWSQSVVSGSKYAVSASTKRNHVKMTGKVQITSFKS